MKDWENMEIKTINEIKKMAISGKFLAEILSSIKEICKPGITTAEVDKFAEELTLAIGAKPTFKGYKGFPATICASVNHEIIHGIPDNKKLKDGDIFSVDMGITYDGWIADSAVTIPIGRISDQAKKLIKVTQESLYHGINMAKSGNRLFDISSAIQEHVEKNGFSIVREFVGHGIGRHLHEDPSLPNFVPPIKAQFRNIKLRYGMTIAIEPMVNEGLHDIKILKNGWTAITKDKKLSAHFEHTIAISKE